MPEEEVGVAHGGNEPFVGGEVNLAGGGGHQHRCRGLQAPHIRAESAALIGAPVPHCMRREIPQRRRVGRARHLGREPWQPVVQVPRRTETNEAPRWQGAMTENAGSI